jgi:hypothetical protein
MSDPVLVAARRLADEHQASAARAFACDCLRRFTPQDAAAAGRGIASIARKLGRGAEMMKMHERFRLDAAKRCKRCAREPSARRRKALEAVRERRRPECLRRHDAFFNRGCK